MTAVTIVRVKLTVDTPLLEEMIIALGFEPRG